MPSFTVLGLVLIIAAIVAGGLNVIGISIPPLTSFWRQGGLCLLGISLVAIDNPTAAGLCPDVRGNWHRDITYAGTTPRPGDQYSAHLDQNGCSVRSQQDKDGTSNTWEGNYVGNRLIHFFLRTAGVFELRVKRRNRDGCQSTLYGRLEQQDRDQLVETITNSDGQCGLRPENFQEHSVWKRIAK
jgi:hypothetical protein